MTMNDHEFELDHKDLDWMAGRQAQRISSEPFVAGDPFARERARQALRSHIDEHGGGRRGPLLRRLFGARALGLVAAAAAVVLAAVVLVGGHGGPGATYGDAHRADVGAHPGGLAARPGGASLHAGAGAKAHAEPLMKLADYVSESPAPSGDATVVRRTTTVTGQEPFTGFDLYGDNGSYFYSESREGLAGLVAEGQEEGEGFSRRELAAAAEADGGNVRKAAEDMANAPGGGRFDVTPAASNYANYVWEFSQDAIIAGAGKPRIRAGVLRILGTLPGVTVTEGTEGGASTLVLTAGAEEMGAGYSEQLTIDAETGVPIRFVGGPPGGPAATTVEYQVTRAEFPGLAAAAKPNE
jgi:hypothetical protein